MKSENYKDCKYGTFSSFKMDSKERNSVTLKVFIDITLASLFTTYTFRIPYFVKPYRRGYFCDDEDLMYPYQEYLVSTPMLWSISILIPTAIILLTEIIYSLKGSHADGDDFFIFNWRVPGLFCRLYSKEGIFLFGLVLTQFVNTFFKNHTGRLRPNFLELCKPNFNCSSIDNPHFYVETFECSNPELKPKTEPWQSFPSGHAAVSTFTMLYAILYIQQRMCINFSTIIKPLLQLFLLCIAAYMSLSRVQDYYHHWDDVVAGSILGLIICLTLVVNQTNLFREKSPRLLKQSVKKIPNTEFPSI